MRSRLLVAAVGVPALLWGPPLLMLAALALLAGIGGGELYHCAGGERDPFLAVAAVFIPCMTVGWYYSRPQYVGVWFILSTLAVFTYAICRGGAVRFQQIAAVLFGGIAIGYAFSSFIQIYNSGVSRGYLLLPFILSFGCDTFAYFTGLAMGRHKLAPSGNVPYGAMAVLALFCGAVAQVGDLSFSLIKREFGVKDYGKIFFAHGGVLDRFDSVLFVAPALAALMHILRLGL